MRAEDLIPAFADALRDVAPGSPYIAEAASLLREGLPKDAELVAFFVDELFNELNEACPPYVYFGALEGDGADYGFWPDIDTLHEDMRFEGEQNGDETILDGLIVQISDHGNVTLRDADRNEIWSVV
tara:strand:- start:42 stop:422 length:381 start_codon:yes stop_codon:yes gene_type:complete